jgi:hypothetical protein
MGSALAEAGPMPTFEWALTRDKFGKFMPALFSSWPA